MIRRTAGVVVLTLIAGLLAVTGVTSPEPAAAGTPSGQIGRWTFDAGSGTTAADSVGTKPATLTSGASWGAGIQGASALVTNGSSGAAVTSASVLNTTSSFSVSAWVKLNNLSGYQTVVSQDGNSASGFYLGLRGDNGKFNFTRVASDSNSGSTVATATSAPVIGQWYHIVGIYNSTATTLSLYVNGRLQQTVTAPAAWSATGSLAIGRGKYNGGGVDWVNGTIDDVSVYSSALSATDVEQITESARWKFDEGSGTTAAEDSANSYTGTLTNGPTWTPGEIGTNAVLFDGVNDSVTTTNTVVDTSKSFSVSAWARADGGVTGYNMVVSVDGTSSSGFYLQLGDGGKWAFNRSSADVASPGYTASNSTATAVSGTWYHLVGVYDSVAQTLVIYVNGVKQTTVSYTTGWKATGNLVIGRGQINGNPVGYWNGAIDDVRAYSYALDAAAVSALAGAAPVAPATPTATAGGSSATVTWAAPTSNGGSNVTGYVVTPYKNGTAQTPVSYDASTTTRTLTGLTPGSSYQFTVAAVNPIGTSPASAQSTAVSPFDVPGPPTITAATAGDTRVSLTWTAPASNGGSAVTGYVVTPYLGSTAQPATTFPSTATTQTVTGLTAGTAYTFKVAAQNAGGTGAQSAASASVTPNANPSLTFAAPPAGVIGTAYSTQLTVNDGTSPFTWSVASGTLPAGITLSSGGLLSGTPTTAASSTFTVQVSDANSQNATKSVTLVVSSTTPAAPAAPTAAAGVTSATVSWTAPASNGSTITGYQVTPYLSGVAQTPVSFDASVTTRTITGLTAGGSYRFTLAAVNANGTGPASAQSNAVTVYDVPAAPTISSVTAGDSRVTVTWTAGSSNGSAITGYVVTPYIGSTAQAATTFASTATTQTVTGLTAGTAYTFKVAAQNAAGTGAQSAASSSVTPNANPTVTSTSPPGGVVGSAYSYQLTNNGGTSPFTWSVTTGTLPAGVSLSSAGLLSGTPTTVGSSTFTVQVSDASSQTATQSLTVVVTARPGTVAAPTATAGQTSAVLTWTAPAANGSAITGYVITPYIGGTAQSTITVDPSAKTRTLNGLTAGSIYTFTVAAVNANGTGTASAASNPVTPYGALNAPTIGSVTTGTTSATLSWTAPTSTGNSAITGYVVTPYIGATAQTPQTFTGTATTRTLTGLTPGTAYTFKVAAQNNSGSTPLYRIDAAGPGAASLDSGPAWSDDSGADNPLRNSGSNTSNFGNPNSLDSTVPATTPLSIFATERWDPGNSMKWAIPVTSGTPILVRLYFVESYFNGPGRRSFDVALDGSTVLSALDIYTSAGGNRVGTMREFAITSDGTVNIDFGRIQDNAIIDGIEIVQTGTATTGPQSAASSSVTPNANPTVTSTSPPGGVVGSAYSYQLTNNGGTSPFTWSVTTGTLPAGVSLSSAGLLSGTPTTVGSSTFTVQVSDASSQTATQSLTVVVTARPGTVAAPTATAGQTSAVLTWTAPAANGSAITGYVITPYIGGTAQSTITVDPSAKTRTLNGLTAGSIYTFTVAAVNANGTGTASAASNPVTPYGALNAPTIGSVTTGTTSATLSWTAPTSTGNSAITGYVVTPYIGATAQTPQTFTGTATTRTLTGLTPGTAYTFKVAAQNNSGTTVLSRIAGGETVSATDGGPDWADVPAYRSGSSRVYHSGSPIGSFDGTVPTTTPAALFLAERFADDSSNQLKYAIPVTSGAPVKVRLYFANTYPGTASVGARVFDVALEGTTVLPAFDPVAAAGGTSIATMREFGVTSDGTVNIDFAYGPADSPNVYAIEIVQTGTATTGPQSAASSSVTPNANPTVTSTSPPGGVVGSAYSYQLTNNGGTSPFTWSVTTGTLPAGVTLSSGGLLSGTPTTVGSSTFTVQVSDASSQTATQSLSVAVSDKPGTISKPTAVAGPTSATVSWTAPTANGSTLTGYVVTPYLSGVAQTPVSFDASTTTRAVTGLTVGGSYKFSVAAVNANGTGAASPQSDAVTIYDVPSAPTITATTAGDLRATLTWTTPAANGNAITGYVVTPYIGATAQTPVTFFSTATTQTITGLTAGTAYTFKVAAQNAGGAGAQSAASPAVTPNANPTVTSTSPPAWVVGSAYSYQLTNSGGTAPFAWSVITGTLPAGLTLSSAGLVSGTPTTVGSSAFTVQVSDGNSQTATSALTIVVSSTTPAAPAAPTAAAGVTSATLSWTAPAANGSAITGYVVTPYLSGVAQTPTSFDASVTTRNVTGLTGGGSYTFTVAAVNANGTGPASALSNAVTVTDVPAAPTITAATAGDLRVRLTWTAPASNGSAITGYVVTPSIGGVAQTATTFSGTATTQTVTGLTAGTAYTFTVAAQNGIGTGQQSAASSAVTPNANPTVATTSLPGGVVGTAYSSQLTASDGTAPFTWSLTTGTLPAGLSLSAGGVISGTPTTVGSSTVTVQVSDANSQTDTRSLTLTVTSRPATPAAPTATAGLTSAVLTWTAPASNGSTITGYVITPYIGGVAQPTITVDPSAKTRTLNGLTAGSIYTFTVAAVNANGTGTASAASNPVTPYAALNAPTIGSVTAGSTSARLSWTAPTSTGGSAITGYVITPYIGGTAQAPQTFASTATAQTITGLTPGTAYTFKVAALNNSGTTVLNRIASAGTVNAVDGGPNWVDIDSYRSGASAATGFGSIAGLDATVPSTTPQALFYTERYGYDSGNEMAYAIPVTAGVPLKVRLYFANQYSGTTTVGSRVFDVALDGSTVLPGFDVIAAAGGDRTGTMREFSTTSDGTVNLDFSHTGRSDPVIYGIEILQTGTATTGPASSASSAVTPNANPTIGFSTTPDGQVAVAYSSQLAVSGGTAPVTWAVTSGSLPTGLTLSTAGLLSGTPTAGGTFTYTLQATDASGQTASRSVSTTIAAAPSIAFSPAAGEVGVAYSQQPTLSGGTGPYTWSISAGSLPGGLSINTSTGLVSGTPTASGTFSVTVRVVDANAQAATRTASIVIAPLPTLTSAPPRQYQQAGFSFTFAATGGTGPFTYAVVVGSLPSGLSLSTAGVLTGQTNQGSYSFTVRATDAKGQSADDPVTLVVDAPPIQLVKTASAASVAPGGTITFTLTATNISSTNYGNTVANDPLADILDDATYNADAAVSSGTVSYSGSTLTWAIPLNAGQSATLTYTVTVANPDTGNKLLTGQVNASRSSTSCSTGQVASPCTATVTVSGLSVTTTANTSSTTPGSTVTYSVVIANTGKTAYPSTSVTQNLSGLLDDATYQGDAGATAGGVTYSSPTLTWTGPLAVGASVTLTYSVRVNDPDTGNRSLTVTALSTAAGSTCPSAGPAASCSSTVPVLVPALAISTSANVSTTTPGGTVAFTMTLANTGQTPYTGTTATFSLAAALDDATYVGSVASAGSYSYASGTVTWTGDLAVGATVTLTSYVTVTDPDAGDKSLTAVASSAADGSTCPAGSAAAACTTTVPVLIPALTIATSSDVSSTTPGSVVHYTVLVTNSGQTPYTGAAVSVPLSGVLDDATYNGDVSATPGTASYASSTINWTGDLAVGASATITYAVTVRQPDPGDLSLSSTAVSSTPGSTCPSGGSNAGCTTTVTVLVPGLTFTDAVTSGPTTTPGTTLRYTVTVVNSGQTTYTNAVVVLDSRGLGDDATFNNDGTESAGAVTPLPDGTFRWVLTLSPGQSATASATYRVNDPPTGDRVLTDGVSSSVPGSSCPTAASPSCSTSVTILVPGLDLNTTADAAAVTPGDTVQYTVVATNSGETAYAPAVVTDDLSGVLTDAVYNNDAAATTGTPTFSGSTLTWSGPLAVGASVTITFTVTVPDPDPGNKQLLNRVVSTAAGSTCPARSTDARCTASTVVNVPGLTLVASAGVATTKPGATVTSTVVVTNSGATPYAGASFSLPLSDVLDDADLTGSVTATSGSASSAGSTITWTGALAVGASATVTYAVTVHAADGGNNRLRATVSSTARGSNCVTGGTDARCATNVPVARLVLTQTAAESTATPGSIVHISTTWANTGQVPYTGISIVSPRADTSDDTNPTGDQTTSSGTLTRTASAVTWTGDIGVGTTVTGTRTLQVKNPDPGNKLITATLVSDAPGNNCPDATTDPACTFTVTVLVPQLSITKTATTTATVAGGTVSYTITAQNTGQTPYTGASWTDSLAGVLDDGSYAGGATVDVGTVAYTSPSLSWSGDLAVGQTATVTYSVTATSPATGDKTMVNVVSSDTPGSTCPVGSSAAACRSTVVVLTQQLAITKTSSVTNATLGSTVGFTVTVTNSGQTTYSAASFTNALDGVLDDAGYNGDAAVTGPGTVGYASGVLSWSGNLSPGATATITYSVTIDDPSDGDLVLTGAVVSSTTGNNCTASSTDARCSADVTVTNAVTLTLTKTADVLATSAGSLVHYTVTAVNSSGSLVEGADFTDALAGVLDDADVEGGVAASSGTVDLTGSTLSWTGDVPAGGTVTVSYAVRVRNPTPGDMVLTGNLTSTSPAASNNCLAISTDPRCSSRVPVAQLVIERYYSQTSTTPGSTVRLNATFTNTGQYAYHGISVSSPTADSSDDAVPTGDQTATSGTLVLTASTLTWTGDIPVGGTVFLTGTLLVKDPDTGNRSITARSSSNALGNNCPPGGTDPRCVSALPVLLPQLSITKTADTSAATPGDVVSYVLTVTDSGETPYTGATVTDDLSDVLDDASWVNNAVASRGDLAFAGGALTWTGDLAVGDSATIAYSVQVPVQDLGDRYLLNTVSSSAMGSTCRPSSADPSCVSAVPVLTQSLHYTVETDEESTRPGQVVTTSVSIANEGQTSYAAAQVSVDLAGVLDDATYNGDAGIVGGGDGTVDVVAGVLTWTGALAPGDTVLVTYSVTVDDPVGGNFRLDQSATSDSPGSFCMSGTDDLCSTSVPVATLHMNDVASVSTVAPTGVVRFTETYTNLGQVPFYGLHITIDGRDTFDDATYNGDATPTSGSLGLDPVTGLLTWTGDILVGQSVTTTGSVTVQNPTPGNKHLRTRISTDEVPSNCPSGSTDPSCVIDVRVLTPGLSIITSPGASTTTPGSDVGYTTTVTNTGETAQTGITVTDDLTGVLDDTAAPTGVGASLGTVAVSGSTLTWTGDLAIGASVTISYTVRVRKPDPGNLNLVNAVSSDALGSSCPTGLGGTGCSSLVIVLIPALDVSVVADTAAAYPGAVVTYTLTVTNSGQTPYVGASATVGLAGVLDDAVYNSDAAPSTGSVSYASPSLTWTGDLAVGDSAVTTYTVTVNDPDTGNRSLLTTVSSAAAGSSCPSSAPCSSSVTVQIPALSVSTTADATSITPGQQVTFTITVHNTGQRAYLSTVTTASLAGVLDDASLRGGFRASSGVVSYNAPNLTWTGLLQVAGTATISYTVQVDDPDTGDRTLATSVRNQSSGSTCRDDTTSSLCSASVSVLVPALAVSVVAGAPTTTPGSVVTYTVLIANTGETPYTGASVTTSLAGLLTDADYAGDAQVSTGSGDLAYADGRLTWTGDLAVGASASVTYSVTVHDPDTGDKQLVSTVVSTAPGSTCPTATTSGCSSTVQVRVPGLVVSLGASPAAVTAGHDVTYRLDLRNTGETDYADATASVSLADVLDDAGYDPASLVVDGAGSADYADQILSWHGPLAQGEQVSVSFSVTTSFPVTGDKSLDATVVAPDPGSSCPADSSDPTCSVHTAVRVPELSITKTASATRLVAGQSLTYTVVATNTGEADDTGADQADLSDDLSGVLAHATYGGDATATTGDVAETDGLLTWSGPLAVGVSVVITYSVTVANAGSTDVVLTNSVTSSTPGATCTDGGSDPLCTTSTTVDAGTLELSGLASSFTLTGQPGDTVSLDDAVVGTVVTNNLSGYTVTVQAEENELRGGSSGNTDTIPIDRLRVRANGGSTYAPLSATAPTTVADQDHASSPTGDALSNDYQVAIPFVSSDTYSGTLDYIVATQ